MLQKLKERLEFIRDKTQHLTADLVPNKVSPEIQQYRYNICQECPKLYKITDTCRACGCFMKVKTWMPQVSCPLDKWGKVEK